MNDNIIYKEDNQIEYIQFKRLLDLGIVHCYTLKREDVDSGTGKKEYDESFDRICGALKIDKEKILIPIQTHNDNIRCVNNETTKEELENTDALITDKKDVVLASRNADCILFLLYDPVKKVIANVHSGWKGTFKKICQKTIIKMINNYGCNPKDILCFISPSIRKCHFEVDEEVKELCEEIFKFTNRTSEFIKKGNIKDEKQKYYIDTVFINKILMEDIGIKSENIIDSGICSVCNKDKINSYRVEGKDFKRAIALIKL